MKNIKKTFEKQIKTFVDRLSDYSNDSKNEWVVKGFIDAYKNVYSITNDTKVVSKILEIHLFPQLLQFAQENGYKIVVASCQNYYPDFSFVGQSDESIRFAVDIKTTYRLEDKPDYCNGFTLGSHGEYFINRRSTKNIQFPYATYLGHYCLGAIYDRTSESLLTNGCVPVAKLQSITSVIRNLQFFVAEKWKIASDKSGSGNTANIGSVKKISDLLSENGTFSKIGEKWFDDYWMNYGKIVLSDSSGKSKKIASLPEFLAYRGKR